VSDVQLRLRIEAALGNTAEAIKALGGSLADLGGKAGQAGEAAKRLGSDFGRLTASFTAANVGAQLVVQGLQQLASAFTAPVEEVIDAERAMARLEGVMRGNAAAIAELTAAGAQLAGAQPFFDDDSIAAAQATLATFGAMPQAIEQLLPLISNLAIANGMELSDAAQTVAQALTGQTRALAMMVPEAKGASSQLEVLQALQSSAGRTAETAAKLQAGLTGSLATLKTQTGEAAQAIGDQLAPALQSAAGYLASFMAAAPGALAGLTESLTKLGRTEWAQNLKAGFTSLAEAALLLGQSVASIVLPVLKSIWEVAKPVLSNMALGFRGVSDAILFVVRKMAELIEAFKAGARTVGAFFGGLIGGGSFKAAMDEVARLRTELQTTGKTAVDVKQSFAEIKLPKFDLDAVKRGLTLAGTFDTKPPAAGAAADRVSRSRETLGPPVPKVAAADMRSVEWSDAQQRWAETVDTAMQGIAATLLDGSKQAVSALVSGTEIGTAELTKGLINAASLFLGPFGALGALAAEAIGGVIKNVEDTAKIMSSAMEGLDTETRIRLSQQARDEQLAADQHRNGIEVFWRGLTGQSQKEHAQKVAALRQQINDEQQHQEQLRELERREAERTAAEVRAAMLKAAEFQAGVSTTSARLAIEEALKSGAITEAEARFQRARLTAGEQLVREAGGQATQLGQLGLAAFSRLTPEQTKAIAEAARSGDTATAARLLEQATAITLDNEASLGFVLNLVRGLALELDKPAGMDATAPAGGVSKPEQDVPGATPERPLYSFVTNPEDFSRYAFMPRSFSFRPSMVSSRAVSSGRALGAAV